MDEPIVEIDKLWTVFDTPERKFVVHQDLDLTVRKGEVLSIVGGSGTGKTVLLRQILGLETPARGEIKVMGEPAHNVGRRGAASRIGMKAGFALKMEVEGLPAPGVLRDIQAAIDHAAQAGKVGIVGYCWGGLLTWRAACMLMIC